MRLADIHAHEVHFNFGFMPAEIFAIPELHVEPRSFN